MKYIQSKEGTIIFSENKVRFELKKEAPVFSWTILFILLINLFLLYILIEELLNEEKTRRIVSYTILLILGIISLFEPFIQQVRAKEIAFSDLKSVTIYTSLFGLLSPKIEFRMKQGKRYRKRTVELPKQSKDELKKLGGFMEEETKKKISYNIVF